MRGRDSKKKGRPFYRDGKTPLYATLTRLFLFFSVDRDAPRDGGWPRHDVLRRGWRARGRYGRGSLPSRDRRPHGAWRLRGGASLLARGVRRPFDGARRLRGQPYFSPGSVRNVSKIYASRLTIC